MNNFEPRYVKISSKYLDEKMKSLGVKKSGSFNLEEKKGSAFYRMLSSVFKS